MLLVVFPPAGIFLLYRFGLPWQRVSRHVVAGVAAVWCIILIAAGAGGDSKDDKETPAEPAGKVTASATPTPTPSAAPSTPSATPSATSAAPATTAPASPTAVPSLPVPEATPPPVSAPPVVAPRTTRAPDPEPDPVTETTADNGGSVYYANCDAAKRAGAAPIRIGEPGYRPALDRDKDGIACDK